MPRGIQPFEEVTEVANFLSMPPPAVPSRESQATDTPFDWTLTPGYTPAPSQVSSQAVSRRRLLPDEELSIVQLAVQHAPTRQSQGYGAFFDEVEASFEDTHGWNFKSIRRKLDTLELRWRKEFKRRGTGTGTENDTDLSQAIEAWIAIKDDENRRADDRAVAIADAAKEREVSTKWRTNAVLRVRDRPPVVTRELPHEHDYIDITSDDEAEVLSPSSTTAAAVGQNGAAAVTTPTRSGLRRGRGVTRRSVSRRGNSSDRSSSGISTIGMLLQIEERREAREERREAAIAAAEERRERREVAARESFMQQINALIQVVVQRPQPVNLVGDYPPQIQLAPSTSSPSTFGGGFDGNFNHPSDARTQ